MHKPTYGIFLFYVMQTIKQKKNYEDKSKQKIYKFPSHWTCVVLFFYVEDIS